MGTCFFFSSRRRHTTSLCDWSSDVCSSDLLLVAEMLARLDHADETIARLSAELERAMAPLAEQVELLRTIPGVDRRVAEVIVAETGGDMARFPSPEHLASWAGVAPGNNESA